MKNICRIALQPALMMPTQRPHSVPAQIPNAARNWIAPTPSSSQPQVLRSVMTYLAFAVKTVDGVDRSDPVDDVQDPDEREHDPGEHDPAEAGVVSSSSCRRTAAWARSRPPAPRSHPAYRLLAGWMDSSRADCPTAPDGRQWGRPAGHRCTTRCRGRGASTPQIRGVRAPPQAPGRARRRRPSRSGPRSSRRRCGRAPAGRALREVVPAPGDEGVDAVRTPVISDRVDAEPGGEGDRRRAARGGAARPRRSPRRGRSSP